MIKTSQIIIFKTITVWKAREKAFLQKCNLILLEADESEAFGVRQEKD